MTAIERLDPKDQQRVVFFIYRLDAERQLTGSELSELAQRMVNATDPKEAADIREAILRGFYSRRQNA